MRIINFIVEETSTGYSTFAEEFPVFTTGEDMAELKYNIIEAMDLYLDEVEGMNIFIGKENDKNCEVLLLSFNGRQELEVIDCIIR